jgi:uncharacterized protein
LKLDPLASDYWSVFDPTGKAGVVVLNETALGLLQCFRHPTSCATILETCGNVRDDAKWALARLAALGLIHNIDVPSLPSTDDSIKQLTVWLHITNQCNLNCNYCYLRKTDECMSRSTGIDAIDAVIRSAIAKGYQSVKLKYSGGEPTLALDRVFAIHDYAEEQCQLCGLQLQAVILSNGTGFTEAGTKGLRMRNIQVMVSLDALKQHQNAQRPFLHGMDSSKQVINGIQRLMEHNLPPHLSVTITSRNCETVNEVVRFALSRNLTFSLDFYRENDCSISSPDLQYSEDEMIKGMKSAFSAIEEDLPPWIVVGMILDRGQLVSPRKHSCGATRDYMVIDHRGHISKCQMEMDRWVTDIHDPDPLEAIHKSAVGVQNPSSIEKEGCRDCSWCYWCGGGCPITTYRATGRYDAQSPNCSIYKAIYPEALRLEGLRLLKYAAKPANSLGV